MSIYDPKEDPRLEREFVIRVKRRLTTVRNRSTEPYYLTVRLSLDVILQ